MLRHSFPILATAILGLSFLAAPAQSSPVTQSMPVTQSTSVTEFAPAGCTTSTEWVQEGNNYYYGRGKVQCSTGRYKVKLLCRNQQTGEAYVVYGGLAVNAPNTATTTCYTGNVAEGVFAVEDPLPTGLTGCTPWMEWVHEGSNHYYGRGRVQCDTGRYKVKIQCRNQQTGQAYVVTGSVAVNAPNTATTTCYSGNVAESVFAVEDPRPVGVTGCATWREWVHDGYNHYYGRGSVQCEGGRYKVKLSCRNVQTGQTYVNYSTAVYAPYVATTTCYTGNVADAVEVMPQ